MINFEIMTTNELLRLKAKIEAILHRRICGDQSQSVTVPTRDDGFAGLPEKYQATSGKP